MSRIIGIILIALVLWYGFSYAFMDATGHAVPPKPDPATQCIDGYGPAC